MNREPTKGQTDYRAVDETIAQDSGLDTELEGDFTTDLPDSLGRYKIESLLGRGGMGAVYLAHDEQLDRKIALKIPKFGSSTDDRLVARFYREARSAATLTHPNLCPVYDVGEIDGTHYIAMAYIQGRTLSSYVNHESPRPQRVIAAIVRKVALAMEEAHRSGIIHRDLKPANIMIDQRKEPIVMDFGLACPQDMGDDSRLTQDGALLGSPAYMSPEQLTGRIDAIGNASDVYSLGVVLYELLTGKLPFDGTGSTIAMIGRILSEQPADPVTLRSDLDADLVSICRKAIAKDPAERYASMLDFGNDLARYIKSSSGESGILGEPTKVRAADVTRIQLTEQSRLAKTLCESGQFVAAVPMLEQIIAHPQGQDTKMVAWAKAMLPKVEAKVAEQSKAKAAAVQPADDDIFSALPATMPAPATPVQPFKRPANRAKSKQRIPPLVWIIPSALGGLVVIGIGAMLFFQGPGEPPAQPPPTNTGTAAAPSARGDTASRPPTSSAGDTLASETDSTTGSGPIAKPQRSRLLRPGAPAEEVFAALDDNHDGYLVIPEIPEPERKRMMEADEDLDGRVSLNELKKANRVGIPPAERPGDGRLADLMSFDDDQDGRVSTAELPLRSKFLMERADVNEDGYLDRSEIDELKRRAESGRGRPFLDRRPGGPGPGGGRPGPGGFRGPRDE